MRIARIYDAPEGQRILVDRLWPRGMSKEKAGLQAWAKDLAPSNELRQEFHASGDWSAFEAAYRAELEGADLSILRGEDVVLVTAAKAFPCHADILHDVVQTQT